MGTVWRQRDDVDVDKVEASDPTVPAVSVGVGLPGRVRCDGVAERLPCDPWQQPLRYQRER